MHASILAYSSRFKLADADLAAAAALSLASLVSWAALPQMVTVTSPRCPAACRVASAALAALRGMSYTAADHSHRAETRAVAKCWQRLIPSARAEGSESFSGRRNMR